MEVVIDSDCPIIPEGASPLDSQGNAVLNLLCSLGYDVQNPPFADLISRYAHLDGTWIALSPIHWQASHNNAMVAAYGTELMLSETESKSFFQLFSDYLAVEGMKLYYYDAHTWLLSADNKPYLNAKPVHQMVNQPLMLELAKLDSTMYWQKFFTESQMFFASLSTEPVLNGVWLWGGAKLTTKKNIPICVDEHHIAIAQICSSNVTLYNPSINLNQFDILLLKDANILSTQHKEQLKKISCQWHWNNAAYSYSDLNWFTRFWRTLTHAH